MSDDITDADRMARLREVRQELREQQGEGWGGYLDIMNVYDADPLAENPFIIPGTFISERVGGSVGVIDQDGEYLADENLNQFLAHFLPGGYRQRWGDFDRYRGNWHFEAPPGFADVAPMIDRGDEYPLSEILEGATTVPYGPISFAVDDVRVYVPESVRVTSENLQRDYVDHVWLPDEGIIWTGTPPVDNVVQLSSSPTMNALWFKHPLEDPPAPTAAVDESDLFVGYGFTDAIQFLRCYYASLLTMYPRGSTQTISGIVRYRHEADDAIAFFGSEEQSQLLTFGLDRVRLRDRIRDVLAKNPRLKRDLQLSFAHTKIWEELFFDAEVIPHEFAIEPLVEHLVGVDYLLRQDDSHPLGVFGLSGTDLKKEVRKALPEGSSGLKNRLRLLGYPAAEGSPTFEIVENNAPAIARILALCRNEEYFVDFAERIAVHSAEHALATWSNEYTGSGTSFELWYDVNFQERDADAAQISVYDPIQGGAGIAKEVAESYGHDDEVDIATGLRNQGRCHTGTADRVTVELLAAHDGKSLYDLFHNDRESFFTVVTDTIDDFVEGENYNEEDITTQVKHRVRSLLETRELGTFYAYVAELYKSVESEIQRTPRVADLALHLDQHVFRDPEVRNVYERFASDTGRRDLSELGERLDELTVGCVNACPDCLQTDVTLCLHGTGPQHAQLNRRLLAEVFDK